MPRLVQRPFNWTYRNAITITFLNCLEGTRINSNVCNHHRKYLSSLSSTISRRYMQFLFYCPSRKRTSKTHFVSTVHTAVLVFWGHGSLLIKGHCFLLYLTCPFTTHDGNVNKPFSSIDATSPSHLTCSHNGNKLLAYFRVHALETSTTKKLVVIS